MPKTVQKFLPYGRQHIDDDDIAAVAAVLRSDFLTTGPVVDAFEKAFRNCVGARHAVVVSSGTAALHLAALAAGLGEGDFAVVPAITFLATANAVRYAGAEVVFADVDPDTGLMTPQTLEDAIARTNGIRLRAVLPVHLNGQNTDMPAIEEIALKHGMCVIEDACHALGATYESSGGGRPASVGACPYSEMAMFSGHPIKAMAMSEGGIITTNDDALNARLRLLRSHGIERNPEAFIDIDRAFDSSGTANPWYYEMHEIGFNFRASDVHCALGLSQLKKLNQFVAKRAALVAQYRTAIGHLEPTVKPLPAAGHGDPAWHVAVALIEFEAAGVDRATVMNRLRDAGIGTQVLYIPVNQQPYYRKRYGEISLPGAERYYARALSLPLFVDMTDSDVEHVVDHLAQALGL
jgi:UDP-4-amino-4,6-dideoxy-N-acetyl-beta-L-altrosamine transaminase